MAEFQLRPLDAGGVFKQSIAAYRHRFGTLMATAAVLDLPYAALYYVLADEPPPLSALPTNEELSEFVGALGPWLVGRLRDQSGAYDSGLLVIVVMVSLSVAAFWYVARARS